MLPTTCIQDSVFPTTKVEGSGGARRRPIRPKLGRAGFTLAETLVSVALVTVLSAVVAPAVINQIKGAELTSVLQELESIRGGVIAFQSDVNRWPLEVNQLIRKPGSTGTNNLESDANGSKNEDLIKGIVFPPGLLKKWNGPYLNRGGLPSTGTLSVDAGGVIRRNFEQICVGRSNYLAVVVEGIAEADAKKISQLKDGETNVTISDDAAGVVRWRSVSGPELIYFAATISPPKC